MSHKLVVITGVSTAGKSTQGDLLRGAYSHVRDIDENGVPGVGRTHWRLYRIDELLGATHDHVGLTIACGIMLPSEIISSRQYGRNIAISYVLLDLSLSEFERRMRARLGEDPGELVWATQCLITQLRQQVPSMARFLIVDAALSKAEIHHDIVQFIEEG